MIICQGVPIMHHFERFTVDLDEKLGDSLLGCPQLYPERHPNIQMLLNKHPADFLNGDRPDEP